MAIVPVNTSPFSVFADSLAGFHAAQNEQYQKDAMEQQAAESKRQFDVESGLKAAQLAEGVRQFDIQTGQQKALAEMQAYENARSLGANLGMAERSRLAQLHIADEDYKARNYATRVILAGINVEGAQRRQDASSTKSIVEWMDRNITDNFGLYEYGTIGNDGQTRWGTSDTTPEEARASGMSTRKSEKYNVLKENLKNHLRSQQTDPLIKGDANYEAQLDAMADYILENQSSIKSQFISSRNEALRAETYQRMLGETEAKTQASREASFEFQNLTKNSPKLQMSAKGDIANTASDTIDESVYWVSPTEWSAFKGKFVGMPAQMNVIQSIEDAVLSPMSRKEGISPYEVRDVSDLAESVFDKATYASIEPLLRSAYRVAEMTSSPDYVPINFPDALAESALPRPEAVAREIAKDESRVSALNGAPLPVADPVMKPQGSYFEGKPILSTAKRIANFPIQAPMLLGASAATSAGLISEGLTEAGVLPVNPMTEYALPFAMDPIGFSIDAFRK